MDQNPENERIRIEIITTEALEEDFDEEFKKNKIAGRYTKIDPVKGAGYSNPRLGDAIWPQLNLMYLIYTNEEECEKIKEIVKKLRLLYITEGISCFISKSFEF